MIISGTLVYDHIMNFPDTFRRHILPDQIHILNVCFMVDKLERSWGGTAGNIGYTVKLLGGEPKIISALGRDGGDYFSFFKAHDIDCAYILKDETQPTAVAYITTDADDNQITAFYSGPHEKALTIDIRDIQTPGEIAIIAPTHKAVMLHHAHDCASAGMRVVFDPGQQMTAFTDIELKQTIERSEFVIGNDYKMKLLMDRTGWGAKDILQHAKVLITTLAGQGSMIQTREGEEVRVKPSPPQSFDDPTGAGDAYRAGFFTGVGKGFDWKTCGQIGSVAASYAIETYGTQEHEFTREEFCDRYKKTYQEALRL
jgi:adenosine kinase